MGGYTGAKALPERGWLLERFRYDADTGVLFWRTRPRSDFQSNKGWRVFNTNHAGRPAGSVTGTGHLNVGIGPGRKVLVHRVIWKMETGDEPEMVDHENKVESDNRWDNLRAATRVQNQGNSGCRRNNSMGLKGVRPSGAPGRFTASMSQNSKKVHLGTFGTKEEAHMAYCEAAKAYFGEFWSAGDGR